MRRKMSTANILIITFEYGREISGGIGSCLNGFVSHIHGHGEVDVTVVVLYWNFECAFFSCIEYRGSSLVKKHTEPLEYTITWLINSKKFDVVHMHHAAREILDVINFIKKCDDRLKLVFSCHSIFKHERNVRAIFDEAISCEQKIFEAVDAIHVLSEISKARLLTNYPHLSSKNIYVIPNGIGRSDFLLSGFKQRINHGLMYFLNDFGGTKKKTIICASRWAPGKGIEFFLDAIPEVLEKYPNTKFSLIGQRNNTWDDQSVIDYKQFLQKKIDSLTRNVNIYGWIDRWRLAFLIKKSDIYIMPSECESFPYSFLEPAFLGTAIIASKIDTVEEMASDGKHFLGFASGNHIDLAQKIIALINDESKKAELRATAKQLCNEKYSWHMLVDSYLKMYDAVTQ
jgi:glycosyltransferase involved in cell wall biosynthesis